MLVLGSLIILFLIIRLINLTLLPVFADEAIYIHWAQVIWHDANNRFIPLSDGKPPLFMWLMVPFLKFFSDPLFAARLLSVLAGLATLIGVYLLGKKLFSKKVAILASIFVIAQPFLLFYDRLAITDSMLTAFGVWSFYTAYLLFQEPTIGKGMLLGTLWGGAMLTKPTGAYYALLTPPFILLYKTKKWFAKIKKLFIPGLLAAGYGLGFYNILRLSGAFHMIALRSADYLRSKEDLLANPFQFIPGTGKVMFLWLLDYLSWPAIALLAISLLLTFLWREKKIGLLFLWALAPFIIQSAIGQIIYPRYLLIAVPFLLIILSWGIIGSSLCGPGEHRGAAPKGKQRCDPYQKRIRVRPLQGISGVLICLILAIWLAFDFRILTNPARAPLHEKEKEQYFYEWSAGYGIREIADYVKALSREKEIAIATEGYFGTLPNGLQIYLDGVENIDIFGVGQPIGSFNEKILKAVEQGKETFLVVNSTRLKLKSPRLQLIAEYPKPEGPKGVEKLLFFKVL